MSMMLKVVPVQSPRSLIHPLAQTTLVTTRVWEMFGLHMVQHILPPMVSKLVAQATLVLSSQSRHNVD